MDEQSTEEYTLTPDELAVINEYNQQAKELALQQQGALKTIARIHGLTGNWDFNGTQLVKVK